MAGKVFTLRMEGDLVDWTSFAASLEGGTMTSYINGLIRQAKEAAKPSVRQTYESWKSEREQMKREVESMPRGKGPRRARRR